MNGHVHAQLRDPSIEWVPRFEAVLVPGDERANELASGVRKLREWALTRIALRAVALARVLDGEPSGLVRHRVEAIMAVFVLF